MYTEHCETPMPSDVVNSADGSTISRRTDAARSSFPEALP